MPSQRVGLPPSGPVILVEQEWPARALLAAELEELGLWVVALPSPNEAIAYLERWELRPALLVLDLIRQPPEELRRVLDLIRLTPEVPIIVLRSPMVTGDPAIETHATRVISRPASIGEIAQVVAELLGG
jgi:CheY-like chemotaxis protein